MFNNIPSAVEKYGTFSYAKRKIEIYDNVFLGAHSIIMGGITIGPNAIVAAGSVVTKDVPEGTIVGGNPAKVIGKFDEYMKKRYLDGK
ncbi:TPA: DapH/DapD/GlmU-related protein [Streptococcus suis]